MTFKSFSVRAAIAIAALAASDVLAADPPKKPQQFEKWEVICEKPPEAKTEHCLATQVQTLKEGGPRLIQVSIGKLGPQGEMVVVTALPLGIFLPAGAILKIDSLAPLPLTITQCTAVGCMAQLQMTEPTVTAITNAKQLIVTVQPVGTVKTIDIVLQLEGLKAALAHVK